MTKLPLLFLIFLFLITGIYLNRSYAYFYDFLGQNYLAPPNSETTIIFGNQSSSKSIKYAALGDSLTAGVGVADIKSSYPYLIAQKLSSKNNVELVNLAHPGDVSSDLLLKLPEVLSQKPDLITILIGINDIHNLKSVKEFESNLSQIITTLKRGNGKIYLLSIPYLGSDKIVYFPYNLILDFRTKQFNNVIKKLSKNYGLEYIDLYPLTKSEDFYSSDQFHPGEEGYKAWSKVVNVN